MTSNIGSQYLLDGVTADGEIKPDARERVLAELRGHFRPEFLNRVDDIVLFTPLTLPQIEHIVELHARRSAEPAGRAADHAGDHAGSTPAHRRAAASTRSTARGRCAGTSPTRSRPRSVVRCCGAKSHRVAPSVSRVDGGELAVAYAEPAVAAA